MPGESHDSWLGALGIDVGQIRAKVQSVVNDVETTVEKGVDWAKSGAAEIKDDVNKAEDWAKSQVASAAAGVKKDAGDLKLKAVGDQSGQPVPRPMESDCNLVHGQVPGPKSHLFCSTHGHVVDIDQKMIIANSIAVYVKDGVAKVVQSVDLRADVGAGALNSPSYVNAQDSSLNLGGGGTASAGDSYFVTGGQQGQLLARAKDIKGAATQFYEIGKKLQEKGMGGMLSFKDDKLLESAKNVTSLADGLTKLASAIDSWAGSGNKESIEKGSKAVDYASKIIDAADAVVAIKKLSVSLDELDKKPSQASVEAWADDVGNAFDKAGGLIDLIPSGALPGFVVDYYKGLLSAPKNYISAFKTIMHAHYDNIDLEAGISGSNQRANNWGTKEIEWEGDLVPIYVQAYFQPKAKSGMTLQKFMKDHRKTEGADLYKVDKTSGKALLVTAIGRDMPDDDDSNERSVKNAWMNFVQGF